MAATGGAAHQGNPPQKMTMDTLLTHLGVTDATHRTAITEDLMPEPEGVENLVDESTDDVKTTCLGYAKRAQNSFMVPRVVIKRVAALVLWAKDQNRIGLIAAYDQNVTKEQILLSLSVSQERDELRRDQKKIGETVLGSDFQIKLKSQNQWVKWSTELQAALNSIIGANGVPISYVIRKHPNAQVDLTWTYEQMAEELSPLVGAKFQQDAKTVHQVILKNIHEDSDAYAYVKPNLRHEDGRRDMAALREHYESDATKQTIINQAEGVLKNLYYKNERTFPFERFSAQLQSAYDDLELCDRKEHDGKIVDLLWDRIQAPGLQNFLAALKVDYTRNQRTYREILHDIAAEVANQKPAGKAFVSGVQISGVSVDPERYTNSGQCPQEGAHAKNGKIFIGKYPPNKWHSTTVQPFHDEIRQARGTTDKPSRSHKRRIQAAKRQQQQNKKLKKEVAELRIQVQNRNSSATISQTTISTPQTTAAPVSEVTAPSGAGSAFGGKSSMTKQGDGNGDQG